MAAPSVRAPASSLLTILERDLKVHVKSAKHEGIYGALMVADEHGRAGHLAQVFQPPCCDFEERRHDKVIDECEQQPGHCRESDSPTMQQLGSV